MSRVDPAATLGSLVAERPARAPLFDRLHLNYCCGGQETLREACAGRDLDVDTVLAALETIDATAVSTRHNTVDWRKADIDDLCAHIVAEHHEYLRTAFPRLEELLVTVVRVHGDAHPELADLADAFERIRGELEPHLATEEERLFPACIAAGRDGRPADEKLLRAHERDHEQVGAELARLRGLAGGDYDPARALCATHRSLLAALADLERDIHEHIHKENYILFTRARADGATAATGDVPMTPSGGHTRESLPLCCQAWIAEQTRPYGRRASRPTGKPIGSTAARHTEKFAHRPRP